MTGNSPKKGEVYWVSLDPTVGVETKKTRPCLVLSNDTGNKHSNIVIVAPITSSVEKIFSFEIPVTVSGRYGKAMINQARAVDKTRLKDKIQDADYHLISRIDRALILVFDITS